MKANQTFDITEKARIYHTMAQLTSSFSSIVRYCEDLEQAGVITSKYRHLFQAFTVEVQSEINLEILEEMDRVEMADVREPAGYVRSGRDISDLNQTPNQDLKQRRGSKHKSPALEKREQGLLVLQ